MKTQSLDSKQSDDKTTQSSKHGQSIESNKDDATKRSSDADEEIETQTFAAGNVSNGTCLMHSCTVYFDLIVSSCQTHMRQTVLSSR